MNDEKDGFEIITTWALEFIFGAWAVLAAVYTRDVPIAFWFAAVSAIFAGLTVILRFAVFIKYLVEDWREGRKEKGNEDN